MPDTHFRSKMKVIIFEKKCTFVLLFLVFASSSAVEICGQGLRTRVQNGTVGTDESLVVEDGTLYPNNTFWQQDDFWWACPCLSGPCVRICAVSSNYIAEIEKNTQRDFTNVTLYAKDAGKFESEIWMENDASNKTALKNVFKLVQLENNAKVCAAPGLVEQINFHTQIFKDGSLRYFPVKNKKFWEKTYESDQFCLFPFELEEFNLAVVCVPDFHNSIQAWLYPILIKISTFFLVLTLIVQYLANKDFKRLHVQLLVYHCVTLICSELVFVAFYEGIGFLENEAVCAFVALLIYYLDLATCFWLSSMCFEIYSTFKCSYGRHNLKMKYFALYAWGTPLIFTLFVVLMQKTLPMDHFMNPKIGYKSCWFGEDLQQYIYYQVPLVVLFVSNMVLFVMTAMALRRSRRESNAALSTNDSKVHQAESDNKKASKSRFSMFLKLFLLMGCNWMLELLSYLFDDLQDIWNYINCFSYLRGVFIFWIFVMCDPNIRKVVQENILKLVAYKK